MSMLVIKTLFIVGHFHVHSCLSICFWVMHISQLVNKLFGWSAMAYNKNQIQTCVILE